MAIPILIIGDSGTGKSTSLRNLKPEETFIIGIINKPLPFKNNYTKLKNKEGKEVKHIYITDEYERIISLIDHINKQAPHIKTLVIDDFQYFMAHEFFKKAFQKGYDKFTEMAVHANNIIEAILACRDDLQVYVLSHCEDKEGKSKPKTIGKMLDDKITLEGKFLIVFHTVVIDKNYYFITQNDGYHLAKTPIGIFEETKIPNDIQYVKEKIDAYYNLNALTSEVIKDDKTSVQN